MKIERDTTLSRPDTVLVSEFSRLITKSSNQKSIISLQEILYNNCQIINRGLTSKIVEQDETIKSSDKKYQLLLNNYNLLDLKFKDRKKNVNKVFKIVIPITVASLVTNYLFIKKL